MRKKGAREESRRTRPTRHNTKARQEGGPPGRKGQSRPDLTNSPPKLRSRPDLVLVVGRPHKYMTTCSLSARTSTGQVLVAGHMYKHMNVCSLSARTSTGRRPTQVLHHGSFSFGNATQLSPDLLPIDLTSMYHHHYQLSTTLALRHRY